MQVTVTRKITGSPWPGPGELEALCHQISAKYRTAPSLSFEVFWEILE